MSKPFTPHPYQQLAIDFMLRNPRCALFAGMGMGKTVSSLMVVEMLRFLGDRDPILVLGPKRVASRVWSREVAKWTPLEHLLVVPVVGSLTARLAALHQRGDVFTINYENIPWLLDVLGSKPWPFRTVIADESTRLKNFRLKGQGGKRATALSQIVEQTDRWINLTGTPAPNGLKNLWGQYWFLDRGKRLGRTYTAFMDRWFYTDYAGVVQPQKFAAEQIYERIADITLSINPKDWFDLEDPIPNVIGFDLAPKLRKAYDTLERDMYTELLCGTQIEAFNAAALTNKCRQFANGAVYTDPPKWVAVHDEKLEALESYVEEASGAPVLVAYEFRSELERILTWFSKDAVDISTQRGFDAFMEGKYTIGIAHPASMGHGVDGLQDVCNRLVYFGHGWDLELRQQMLERIGPMRQKQSGRDVPVWVSSIVANDTIDDVVLARHETKREVQDLLLEAMSRRAL